jgi:anti-sigma-K factor RskA
MVVHGFVVSGVSILFGFGQRASIKQHPPPDRRSDLWRAAHASTSVAGALMIAIGGAFAALDVHPGPDWPLNLFLPAMLFVIATGYAFAAAIGTAALSTHEHRGHTWGATTLNRVSYILYCIAMVACLVGSLLLVPVLWWLLGR